MTTFAYLFEANSIQQYILASGRLRECVGASEMLVKLTGDVLDEFCKHFLKGHHPVFSRRAGGAIYAFFEDEVGVQRMAACWPLIVRQFVPGLAFTQASAEGESQELAFEAARDAMVSSRNRQLPELPGISPAAQLAPRTGRPAAGTLKSGKDREVGDSTSLLKSRFAKSDESALGGRFCNDKTYRWPLDLQPRVVADADQETENSRRRRERDVDSTPSKKSHEPALFPFTSQGQYLAIVHIDGNSLGERLRTLTKEFPKNTIMAEHFWRFSKAIDDSTQSAAQQATAGALVEHASNCVLPARPIVLGGDDVTIIVRADLALDFVMRFLAAFEIETKRHLEPLGLGQMSACAGVVFVKPTHPFHLSHALAEELCGVAKRQAKVKSKENVPASVCFHRITNALDDVADDSYASASSTHRAYAMEAGKDMPAYSDLKALLDQVTKESDSTGNRMRALLGLAASSPQDVVTDYRRWRDITLKREAQNDRNGKTNTGLSITEFERSLAKLAGTGSVAETGLHAKELAVLGDLLTLRAISGPKTKSESRHEA